MVKNLGEENPIARNTWDMAEKALDAKKILLFMSEISNFNLKF